MIKNKKAKLACLLLVLAICMIFIFAYKKEKRFMLELNNSDILLLEERINKYIDEKNKNNKFSRNFFYHKEGVITLCEFKILGMDQSRIYLWLIKAEYCKADENIKQQNIISLPFVFKYKNKSDDIVITGYAYPRDGSSYGKDITRLFPTAIIEKFPDYEEIISLNENLEHKAFEKLNK